MNSIRIQLLRLMDAQETWGFVTKEHRLLAGLPKTHASDAATIAPQGKLPIFCTRQILFKNASQMGIISKRKV